MKTKKIAYISVATLALFAATYTTESLLAPTTVVAAEKRTAYNVTALLYANNPAAEKVQISVSDKGAEEIGHDFSIDVNLSSPATGVSAFAFSIFDANGKEITVESDGGVHVGEKNFHYPAGASISQSKTGVIHVKDLPAGTYTVKMSGHSISENDDRIFYGEKSFTLPGFGDPAPEPAATTVTTTTAAPTTQTPTTTQASVATTTQASVTTEEPKTTQAPAVTSQTTAVSTTTQASTTTTEVPTTAQPMTSMDETASTSKGTVQKPVTAKQPKTTKKGTKATLPKTGTAENPTWVIAGLALLGSLVGFFFKRKES